MTNLTKRQIQFRNYYQKRKQTHTTIMISKELRDLIKKEAHQKGYTIEEYIKLMHMYYDANKK